MSNNARYKVEEVGVFQLVRKPRNRLSSGEVGYIIANIKTVSDVRVGDTITLDTRPAETPLPGFKEVKPVVFSSLYPMSTEDFGALSESLEEVQAQRRVPDLPEGFLHGSGQGFRCGFLGSCTWRSFRNGSRGSTAFPSS